MQILLHGGYAGKWEKAGADHALFQKLIDAACAADGKILVAICAYETPDGFPHLEAMHNTFHDMNPKIEITIAGRGNFAELVGQHQVLFLQGGNSQAQKEFMDGITKETLCKNKTLIAGSSSGAMVLCRYGLRHSQDQILEGKGIVDLAVVPHANKGVTQDHLAMLQQKTTAPILLLGEMQMATFDVSEE